LLPWLAFAAVYSLVVAIIVRWLALPSWSAGNEMAATLTLVLGILVVFRNNAANDRWWEARKLWGQLINDLRNLALKVHAHVELDGAERRRFAKQLVGFAHALRMHLRGPTTVQSVPGFETDPTTFPHAPGYIAGLVHQALADWNRRGLLRETVWVLDVHARSLMDICGACERIRNTPLASSFRSLLRGALALEILVAPWPAAIEFGWWGVPAVMVAVGFLIGIEMTAEEIEEPFGLAGDDLPLETYCQTIEKFVPAAMEG
jgi:putative membrane protein